MRRSNFKSKIVICILLCVFVLSISGCGGPYSAKKRNITQIFQKRQKNALNSNKPSELTLQYLRLENLKDRYEHDREAFFKEFYEQVLEKPELDTVRAMAELALLEGRKRASHDIELALGFYLTSAEASYRYLLANDLVTARAALNPTYRFVAELYNAAVAELVEIHEQRKQTWDIRGTYSVLNTIYEFERAEPSNHVWDPDAFDSMISSYKIESTGLRNHYFEPGLGASLIGLVENPYEKIHWGEFFTNRKAGYPVTVMLIFDTPRIEGTQRHVKATILFYNPLTQDEITLNQMRIPLEVDYSTPLVIQLENIDPSKLGISSMFHSDKLVAGAQLFMLEPYNPDKIPVVMVHGLMSSPITWTDMFNDLRGQPEIRERYQFWFFSYPTGLPILYSSSILRQQLLDFQQKLDPAHSNPNFNNMVLVGHSMGGMLSRMMMQDSENYYWDIIFTKPIDQLEIEETQREFLRQVMFFRSIPFIQRVVFISTPHRGSPIADRWYSSFASGMIDLPANLTDTVQNLVSEGDMINQQAYEHMKKVKLRSINNLSASSPFNRVYNEVPVRDDVTYHSIIGTRKDDVGPGSSDGVVPYESSHIDFAVSERLVHSHHDTQQDPDAINEIKRILLLHLEETQRSPSTKQ